MKASIPRSLLWCAIPLLCISIVSRAMGNSVVNGGFETGDFTGWTVNDPSGFTNIGPDPLFAHSGTYHANLGALGLIGTLSQNIVTTPGTVYNLSFWLTNDSGVPPNEFDVLWNGVTIYSATNSAMFPYTNFFFPELVATGPSTALVFRYRNDDDFFRLDDVSVNVPDPASTLWLAFPTIGLLFLVNYRWSRRGGLRNPA